MKKRYILLTVLALTLILLLSGCGSKEQSLDGMYVVTFELNGGILDVGSYNVNSKINFAYEPGSHILDPTTYGTYDISRLGYRFTGWYTSAECRESEKWDFASKTIEQEKVTLYAGWVKEIVYSYSVCYLDGEETVTLGTYTVSAGTAFEDYRNHAAKREGFTPFGYYTDAACTTAWDFATVHPGGEVDTDVKVYVDYIPGEWILVGDYSQLKNAIGKGNIYLTADIDCEGGELFFSGTFRDTLEGNGHVIRNFNVEKSGGALIPSSSIFQTLGEGAVVQNVTFDEVTFHFFDVDRATKIRVAALARDAAGCTVSNVTVRGVLETNYAGELPRINEAFSDEESTGTITGFASEVTIERQ